MLMVLSSCWKHCESSPGSHDECRNSASGWVGKICKVFLGGCTGLKNKCRSKIQVDCWGQVYVEYVNWNGVIVKGANYGSSIVL